MQHATATPIAHDERRVTIVCGDCRRTISAIVRLVNPYRGDPWFLEMNHAKRRPQLIPNFVPPMGWHWSGERWACATCRGK